MLVKISIALLSIIGIVCVIIQPVYGETIDNWKVLIKPAGSVNSTFWPSELQAKKNETIVWENDDSIGHTVTSGVPNHPDYAGKIFDSGLLKPGDKFTFTLPNDSWSADYYFCKIHPWMTGKIDAILPYLGVSPLFTVTTDKSTYYDNDIIHISGHINGTHQHTPITIQIFDQHRDLVFLKMLDIPKSNYYSYDVDKLNTIFSKSGNYKIKIFYGFPSVVTDANFVYASDTSGRDENNVSILIPKWEKNNAIWWTEGSIETSDFVNGMQYMVETKIMKIPLNKSALENRSSTIPLWVKSNIQMWAEGKLSDNEFIVASAYLFQQ